MIEIVQADITTLQVDAIVNAANSTLAGGGGVDGAIHDAAGPELKRASVKLAPCDTGNAVMTPGFGLPARFVIHAVGPVWYGGERGEEALLRRTYEHIFAVAASEPSIRSLALPAISTGVFRFPKERAAEIAIGVMYENVDRFDRIVACAYDARAAELYRTALRAVTGAR